VALAAGYLDPEPREKVRALRKQVLVVVTASWHVLAFNHNLELMWEADVEGASTRAHAKLHEVAVAITPHRVRGSDRGLVVVGGDVEVGELAAEAEGRGEADAAGAGRAGGVLEGVLQDELRWEAEQGEHARSAPRSGKGSDASASAAGDTAVGAGADTSRHFDYYAFEGGGGESRWSHRAGAFHDGELEAASEELVPQHSFKLDAEKLAGRHYGELSCREFRESILHALPHMWTRPADTRLEEAAFVRHREGVGAQKTQLARAAAARAATTGEEDLFCFFVLGCAAGGGCTPTWLKANKSTTHEPLINHPPNRPTPPPGRGAPHTSHSSSSGMSWLLGARSSRAAASHNHHGQSGVAARHPHNAHNISTNALVTHLQQGLEVVHLFTGGEVVCLFRWIGLSLGGSACAASLLPSLMPCSPILPPRRAPPTPPQAPPASPPPPLHPPYPLTPTPPTRAHPL